MSSFCVYGVSKTKCKQAAEKKVPLTEGVPKRTLTMPEWLERVEKVLTDMFENGRAKQISPAFDAPHFATDWINIGLQSNEIRSPKVMVKGEKVDKNGEPVLRKGKPVIGWVPYKPKS